MNSLDIQALGNVPMVIETSGRGERAYDIDFPHQKDHALFEQAGVNVIGAFAAT